jgi:hypothetical protein
MFLRNYQVFFPSVRSEAQSSLEKQVKTAQKLHLGKGMMTRYMQQCSCNMNVRDVEIKSAANTIAKHIKI